MIPAFTEQGFLPPGIYQATLDEFKERFVIFQRSDRRLRLFVQLEKLLDQAARAGIVKRILIAGSFVSAKPEPNDFDCIVVLDPSIVGKPLRPFLSITSYRAKWPDVCLVEISCQPWTIQLLCNNTSISFRQHVTENVSALWRSNYD